eukprot:scaffold127200_cov31-Tisochrysis_lutea.AAC.1
MSAALALSRRGSLSLCRSVGLAGGASEMWSEWSYSASQLAPSDEAELLQPFAPSLLTSDPWLSLTPTPPASLPLSRSPSLCRPLSVCAASEMRAGVGCSVLGRSGAPRLCAAPRAQPSEESSSSR